MNIYTHFPFFLINWTLKCGRKKTEDSSVRKILRTYLCLCVSYYVTINISSFWLFAVTNTCSRYFYWNRSSPVDWKNPPFSSLKSDLHPEYWTPFLLFTFRSPDVVSKWWRTPKLNPRFLLPFSFKHNLEFSWRGPYSTLSGGCPTHSQFFIGTVWRASINPHHIHKT